MRMCMSNAFLLLQVPAVNAAWMDSFVRQYDQVTARECVLTTVAHGLFPQVDINLVVGEGSTLRAPLLRDVGSRGLSSLSREVSSSSAPALNHLSLSLHLQIKEACEQPGDEGAAPSTLEPGTFTIHNLGICYHL